MGTALKESKFSPGTESRASTESGHTKRGTSTVRAKPGERETTCSRQSQQHAEAFSLPPKRIPAHIVAAKQVQEQV